MEGPYWQHIPPLFAYVPYLFFKLDGQVTIEVKRLSYAFVTWLTGLLCIFAVYRYKKSLLAALSATIAALFWINTPFTHELITGYAFGVSDIVLAFTVVASFGAIIWYLRGQGAGDRVQYPLWKLALMSAIVALPIIAKNLLGAIPPATFFALLIWDHRSLNKKVATAVLNFLGLLLIAFLPLYFSSPETFKKEIIVSFLHFTNLEGWDRPWHWYLTNYLPRRYLFGWTWVYYGGLILASIYNIRLLMTKKTSRPVRVTIAISAIWFFWNLVGVSLVTSKTPNFIYQSYLLSLFFIVYSLLVSISNVVRDRSQRILKEGFGAKLGMVVLAVSILVTGYEAVRFVQVFHAQRAQAYNYQSEHEKFYQLAENLRDKGLDTRDLVIINNPPDDCWARYYILFLTGTEAKTLLEMHFNSVSYESIKKKYRYIYYVDQNFDIWDLDNPTLDQILIQNKLELDQEIQRIKKDQQSCQWLVPDSILNSL